LNRAIANLQRGSLDDAERDYAALLKDLPDSHTILFGLAEVAARRNDTPTAVRYWERYLATAPKGTEEFQTVEKRLAAAKGGPAR
jgi:predicted Zn-dependent protease